MTTTTTTTAPAMEYVHRLAELTEPPYVLLTVTAVTVMYASGARAHAHDRRHGGGGGAAVVTLGARQAALVPVAASAALLTAFYAFSASAAVALLTAVAAATATAFCVAPAAARLLSWRGRVPWTRAVSAAAAAAAGVGTLAAWAATGGHWILNNALGAALCVAVVCLVRLPNARVCALLLCCLFVYDVFWVCFSERIFGANVMVSVATQRPAALAARLPSLPGGQARRRPPPLQLPVKLVFPRGLGLWGAQNLTDEYVMLGLGDVAIPGMLFALVISFDYRKYKDAACDSKFSVTKNSKYAWHALYGYTTGLLAALAAGVLTRAPQPALLYLVPSTLGPVIFRAWNQSELEELWNGSKPGTVEKVNSLEV